MRGLENWKVLVSERKWKRSLTTTTTRTTKERISFLLLSSYCYDLSHSLFLCLSWFSMLTKGFIRNTLSVSVSLSLTHTHFLSLCLSLSRKQFFYAQIQSITDYASTLWDSAGANTLKPLSSIHTLALELILLKSSNSTARGYKSLGILPHKSKLEYDKGIMMHTIARDSALSTLMANFCTNRNRHRINLLNPFLHQIYSSVS